MGSSHTNSFWRPRAYTRKATRRTRRKLPHAVSGRDQNRRSAPSTGRLSASSRSTSTTLGPVLSGDDDQVLPPGDWEQRAPQQDLNRRRDREGEVLERGG